MFEPGSVVAFKVADVWQRGLFVRSTDHRVEVKVAGVSHVYFRKSVQDMMVWMEAVA